VHQALPPHNPRLLLSRPEPSGAEQGAVLDAEARAAGYVCDDIRGVIDSYTRSPDTGVPTEVFRHYRLAAAVPPCDPARAN
jgi:hypothetical protein